MILFDYISENCQNKKQHSVQRAVTFNSHGYNFGFKNTFIKFSILQNFNQPKYLLRSIRNIG